MFHGIPGRVNSERLLTKKKKKKICHPAFLVLFVPSHFMNQVMTFGVNPQRACSNEKKKWTFDHILLHLYVNSSCSKQWSFTQWHDIGIVFQPSHLRLLLVCVRLLSFHPSDCVFAILSQRPLLPRLVVMLSCASSNSTDLHFLWTVCHVLSEGRV